jgi:hypothetical protein
MFNLAEHEWLKIGIAHANCYLEGHAPTHTNTAAAFPTIWARQALWRDDNGIDSSSVNDCYAD